MLKSWEVVLNSCSYIAEEMGVVMRNTAFSPNIKDRLDMSAAITDCFGRLVAQAEHIPVHLGSMPIGVKNLISCFKQIEEGDVLLTNDPYVAGTHANDVTMASPVFFKGEIAGYVAIKAHYVDIGGCTPGSLSASATELCQEGLVVPPVKLCEKASLKQEILKIFSENSRTPVYVYADAMAQISALKVGVKRLKELFEARGEFVKQAWNEALEYVRRYTKKLVSSLPKGRYRAEDYIELKEKDIAIRLELEVSDGIKLDYSKTHPQVDAPVNAVYGVTVSSSVFALKSALDPEMPVNSGFFDVVEIIAPEGCLLNPKKPAPVSAGNVETSQRVADVVLNALSQFLDLPAASQGTMNNLMVGGKGWAFYETIGGGSGARPNENGVSGVHTNMTNTLNTPIEVIESAYPMRVIRYELRENSGGVGKFRGGDGIIREIELLEDSVVTIVGERVRHAPWGVKGGKPGSCARYSVIVEGKEMLLDSKQTVRVPAHSVIRIMTPGGGGYGSPE